MARVDLLGPRQAAVAYANGGVRYVVETPSGVTYVVFLDSADSDVKFTKTDTNGLTLTAAVTVRTGTVLALSVWYDRWSDISAGLIHCAYVDNNDVFYRSINTESSDTLSTETTIFDGASAVSGAGMMLSIARARGGNLGCIFNIDAGAEDGYSRSTDVGANWAAGGDPTEAAAGDFAILLPGWNASDTQDMMAFFWDASADEISRKLYDDSGGTWAETSIAGTMVETAIAGVFPNFAAAVDITNSRNLLVAWSNNDTANADLRCWHVTESAITERTNVVLNSGDDQSLCAIGIDTATEDWYVFYTGLADGSQTHSTAVRAYYKVSTDDGGTWGGETLLGPLNITQLTSIYCAPRSAKDYAVYYQSVGVYGILNVEVPTAGTGVSRARAMAGVG
jgi:hypothetical protein